MTRAIAEPFADGLNVTRWRVAAIAASEAEAQAIVAAIEGTPSAAAYQPISAEVTHAAMVNPDALGACPSQDDPPETGAEFQMARQVDHALNTDGDDAPCTGPVCGLPR